MISRQTAALAATLAVTTAMGGCAGRGPQVPPGSNPAARQPTSSDAGLPVPIAANYVRVTSVPNLLARPDARLAPEDARPTLAQLRQLVPGHLTGNEATRFLLRVPANMVNLPKDLLSSDIQTSSYRGGSGGGGRMGYGGGSMSMGRGSVYGGGRMGYGGGSMVGGRNGTYGENRAHSGWAARGASVARGAIAPGMRVDGPETAPGFRHPIAGNPGASWHGRSVGVRVGGRAGPPVLSPDWGPDGGGFTPMGDWNLPFFGGLGGCGCGFFPFDFLGGLFPFPGGLFPFSFYPFAYDGFVFLTPFALADGLWYPFFPPFYLLGGALAPYPGFLPPLPGPLPPGPYGGPGPGPVPGPYGGGPGPGPAPGPYGGAPADLPPPG